MVKIGLVSDTHGFWDERLDAFFDGVDELWHAGDIGTIELYDGLAAKWTLRAVYGNIDGGALRLVAKPLLSFEVEGVSVLMTHIGGYPGRYEKSFKDEIMNYAPKLVIVGHSHILKVLYDKKMGHLHMNPGAAGISGFHSVRTALRFTLDNGDIRDVEVAEWERR